MSQSSRKFAFSIPITELTDGKFDKDKHIAAVLPIRARLMTLPGIYGCDIERQHVDVFFYSEIVGASTVERHVRKVFREVAAEGQLFTDPSAAGKKLRLIAMWRLGREKTPYRQVQINYRTSTVTQYFNGPNPSEPFNWEKFRAATYRISSQMTKFNGVYDWDFQLGFAWIKIDTRAVTVAAAKAHLLEVFSGAVGQKCFPEGDPEFDRSAELTFFPYGAPKFKFDVAYSR